MKYDIIIIGSGLGGLECASLLSKAGCSVLVLEQGRQPGGCLQSYRRGQHWFDSGLHYVGGLDNGQPLHDAFDRLGLLSLEWQRLDADGFDRVTIGQQTYHLAEGNEHFVETLAEHFPQERAALRDYVKMLEDVGQGRTDAMQLIGVNAYDYLTSTFSDPMLVNVLSGPAMKLELRRESLPLFTFAHSQSSYIQSSWRLRGDGGMLVRKLVSDIQQAGGQVLCGAAVQELNATGGRIASARCSDGRQYEGRVFISDVHPALTMGLVKADGLLKPIFRKRLSRLENTEGILTVSLVLKPGVLPYFNHNKYVYRKPNVWDVPWETNGLTEVDRVMVSCRVPEPSAQGSDAGCLLVDLLTPMPWSACQAWEHTTVGRRGQLYEQQKEQWADECVRLAEHVIPGLAGMVSQRYVSTPLTYRDYTQTPCGSAFGIRKDCRQPLLTMLSPQTPIANLLLTGQSLAMHGLEGVTMTAMNTVELALTISSPQAY